LSFLKDFISPPSSRFSALVKVYSNLQQDTMINRFLTSLWVVTCLFSKTGIAAESSLIIPETAVDKHIEIPYIPITTDSLPTTFPEYNSQLDSSLQYAITTPVKAKTNFQIFMLGEHYQSIYLEKHQFPVLDLATYKSGVKVLKK